MLDQVMKAVLDKINNDEKGVFCSNKPTRLLVHFSLVIALCTAAVQRISVLSGLNGHNVEERSVFFQLCSDVDLARQMMPSSSRMELGN